jgi:hypothetical protein
MKNTHQMQLIAATVALLIGTACYVDDPRPESTSCAPPDGAELTCVACTGGHCPDTVPINNQVTATVQAWRGTHKAVVGDPDAYGLDTYQSTLSQCEIRVDYVCNGTHYNKWIDTSNCHPPHYDQIPAGALCSPEG